jgi:pimeloyl-ACP methyl ester carboxylesterase
MNGRTYVLVPGAWQGAWCWRPVAERLRAAGHRAITLTLPGMGDGDDPSDRRLQNAIQHIVDEVRRLELDEVTLVAHSWGGYPTTGAAQVLDSQVSKIVYFNAQVPLRGRCLIDDNPPERRELLLGLINESPFGAIVPTLSFVEQIFMQDVTPELQRLVADLLTP